nr:hypothetical protein [Tanacetum cinerariifolium]
MELRLTLAYTYYYQLKVNAARHTLKTAVEGFKQIIDFLNANPIKYALMMNPTVYTSCIEQFSANATAKNINREVHIHTKVDGKKVIIFEATVRKDLKFEDKEGVDCLSNEVIFEQLLLMSTMASAIICLAKNQKFNLSKYIFDSMERIFSGKETPLFPTMLVPAQEEELGEGSTMPSAPQHIPINQPSTSKPQKKEKPRKPRRQDPEETQLSGPTANVAYEALNEKNVLTQSNDPPLSRVNTIGSAEDTLKLNELMELCTKLSDRVLTLETTKTAQAKEILSLKRRVKRLEKTKRSRTHRLKRLYKIGLSARVESFAEEQSLGEEDASKQERNIVDIDADAETILVNETTKDQGRYNDEEMFDIDVLNNVEVVLKDVNIVGIATAVTAVVTTDVSIDDITLAQALVEIKTSKPNARGIIMLEPSETSTTTTTITILISLKVQDKGKGIMEEKQGELTIKEKSRLFVELMEKRKKHFVKLRAEEQRRKPPTKAQKRNQMCVYLKNMVGFTHNQLKNKSFDEVQKAFDKTMSWINSFVPMDSEVVKDKAVLTQESSSKRAGDKLDQERSKKQKVEDDKEFEELKRCLEIIPDDRDEVTIDATSLSIKTPFIDYKIYKEGKHSYFQIFRADENSQMYYTFSKMLKNFDREDLEVLWRLVKDKFIKSKLVDDMDSFLLHTLKTMFEHHVKILYERVNKD